VPLLEDLLVETDAARHRVWLDLGTAQNGLLLRLRNRRARLIVADLPASRADLPTQWYLPDAQLPPQSWHHPVDRILAWDLLDYLDAPQIRQLAERLASHAAPQCRMHALVHYAAPGMPAQPGSWRFDRDGALHAATISSTLVPAPRYSPKALEKAMPQFRVERTVLLNNGMQEFIFALGH